MGQLTNRLADPFTNFGDFDAISWSAVAGLTRSPPFPFTGEFHETGDPCLLRQSSRAERQQHQPEAEQDRKSNQSIRQPCLMPDGHKDIHLLFYFKPLLRSPCVPRNIGNTSVRCRAGGDGHNTNIAGSKRTIRRDVPVMGNRVGVGDHAAQVRVVRAEN